MQNLKEIYYSSNLNPIPNPDLLFLSADGRGRASDTEGAACASKPNANAATALARSKYTEGSSVL